MVFFIFSANHLSGPSHADHPRVEGVPGGCSVDLGEYLCARVVVAKYKQFQASRRGSRSSTDRRGARRSIGTAGQPSVRTSTPAGIQGMKSLFYFSSLTTTRIRKEGKRYGLGCSVGTGRGLHSLKIPGNFFSSNSDKSWLALALTQSCMAGVIAI